MSVYNYQTTLYGTILSHECQRIFLKQKKKVLTLHFQNYIWQIQTQNQTRLKKQNKTKR